MPRSYNQKVTVTELEPRWLAAEHALTQPANKNIRHATLKPPSPTAAPGTVHCSAQSVTSNLSFEIYLGSMIYSYLHSQQHTISIFSLHNPHPLLCKDLLIAPRHSALPFKRSPLFLESGQGVHTSLPTGILSLSIFSSCVAFEAYGIKCYK